MIKRISRILAMIIAMICAGMFVFVSSTNMIVSGDLLENNSSSSSEQSTETFSDAVNETNEMLIMNNQTHISDYADNLSIDNNLKEDTIRKKAGTIETIKVGMTYRQVVSLIGIGTISKAQSCNYPFVFLWDLGDGKTLELTFTVNKDIDKMSQEELEDYQRQSWWRLFGIATVSDISILIHNR